MNGMMACASCISSMMLCPMHEPGKPSGIPTQ
jgi:hypothetical protein